MGEQNMTKTTKLAGILWAAIHLILPEQGRAQLRHQQDQNAFLGLGLALRR